MDDLNRARTIALINLRHNKYKDLVMDQEIITKEVNNVFLMPGFESVDKNELIEILKADFNVRSGDFSQLIEKNIKPWLNESLSSEKVIWNLWNSYKKYLIVEEKFPPNTVDKIDDLTNSILDKCFNPKIKGSWDRRGMVVGNVQSGKTANYTGLINKATDAGYRFIIVIAGIHNSLRSQTQERIDEGFIGRDSSHILNKKPELRIGVGIDNRNQEIFTYTSCDDKGDFDISIAKRFKFPIGTIPTIIVIKKNKSILENLILWLNQFAIDSEGTRKILDVPLMVIDDEADNASVNSGTNLEVKTINGLIRTLLNLFSQKTFIGYTATPYANLFIPSNWSKELKTSIQGQVFQIGEDLFPRDFIINIPPPTNYIGAKEIFGFEDARTGEEYDGLDVIRQVYDSEDYFPKSINKKNVDKLPDDLPDSLKKAVQSFILTCAIRRVRNQKTKHNSMLVHVSLRVSWIDRIAWLINDLLRNYKNQIKSGQGNIVTQLEILFKTDYLPTSSEVISSLKYEDPLIKVVTWDEVKNELKAASSKIEVRSSHGLKKTNVLEYHNITELDYDQWEDGLSVIAVGGNKLARGITLEGLSISYYLRTTRMYDSLMQMGRWFGYRPGYADLCRLFTTEELVNYYQHVTMATEEMRNDFDELASNPKKTPSDFLLKVRTHSGMLNITSVSKMKEHDKIQVGYSGDMKQTYVFDNNQKIVNQNYDVFMKFFAFLNDPIIISSSDESIKSILFNDVSSEHVINFLKSYNCSNDYIKTDVIAGYIKKQNEKEIFNNWNIALIGNSSKQIRPNSKKEGSKKYNGMEVFKIDVKCNHRTYSIGVPFRYLEGMNELRVPDSKNAILGKSERMIDLDLSSNSNVDQIKAKRNELGIPLLVVMPLDSRISSNLEPSIPLIGFGIMFPKIGNEETYEYAIRPLKDFEEYVQESDDPADEN
jgi:hypothetical protein